MTVIRAFSIRILLMLPQTTFTCNQILLRSLRARRTECLWENWILTARHASHPERLISAATKDNRSGPC